MTQTTVETTNYTTCMKKLLHISRYHFCTCGGSHGFNHFFLNCQDHNMNKNAKNNLLNYEKRQKFLINCIFILIYEVFNVQKLLFFSVLQTIETSFGFMTHLKECMQRQLFKSPKLSFGLAKFQLPLSVLLKRVHYQIRIGVENNEAVYDASNCRQRKISYLYQKT